MNKFLDARIVALILIWGSALGALSLDILLVVALHFIEPRAAVPENTTALAVLQTMNDNAEHRFEMEADRATQLFAVIIVAGTVSTIAVCLLISPKASSLANGIAEKVGELERRLGNVEAIESTSAKLSSFRERPLPAAVRQYE